MQCIRRNECFRIARPERIIRRAGFGNDQRNSIPLNTKGILNGCPLYFHRPATRQNSTDHRGTIRTFVPLSTASPRQDGNKFALHPLIRIFPKYSNAATLKKFGSAGWLYYLCRRQEAIRQSLRANPHDCSHLYIIFDSLR